MQGQALILPLVNELVEICSPVYNSIHMHICLYVCGVCMHACVCNCGCCRICVCISESWSLSTPLVRRVERKEAICNITNINTSDSNKQQFNIIASSFTS